MKHFKDHLNDEAGTIALGAALARALVPGLTIYLHGDLGAGKTTLTRAMLHAAGFAGHVKSPTYTLAEPYLVPNAGRPLDSETHRAANQSDLLDDAGRRSLSQVTVNSARMEGVGAGQ